MKRARIALVLLLLGGLCAPVAPARALGPNLLDGMVHYWSLDEVSGVRYATVGPLNLTDNNTVGSTAGVVGNAASFVMTNTESLSAASPVNLFPITVNGWFKQSYIGVSDNRAVGSYGSDTTGFIMYGSSSDAWYQRYYVNANNYAGKLLSIANNTWFMATFVVSGNTLRACINASCTNGVTVGNLSISTSDRVFRIGGYNATANFNGLIDEVGIWNRALTDEEIAALYNGGAGLAYDEMRWLYVPDIEDGTLSDATDNAQTFINAIVGLLLYAIGLAVGLAIVIVIMRMFKWM